MIDVIKTEPQEEPEVQEFDPEPVAAPNESEESEVHHYQRNQGNVEVNQPQVQAKRLPFTSSRATEQPFTQEELDDIKTRMISLHKKPNFFLTRRQSTNGIFWVTPDIERRIYALDPFEDIEMNELLQDILLRTDCRGSLSLTTQYLAQVVWDSSVVKRRRFSDYPHKTKFLDLFFFILGYETRKKFRMSLEYNRITNRLCTLNSAKIFNL